MSVEENYKVLSNFGESLDTGVKLTYFGVAMFGVFVNMNLDGIFWPNISR